MLKLSEDFDRDSPVNHVITVNECMTIFDIKDRKTIHIAIWTGRLDARKADSDIGEARGFYLISFASAHKLWADRIKDKDNA